MHTAPSTSMSTPLVTPMHRSPQLVFANDSCKQRGIPQPQQYLERLLLRVLSWEDRVEPVRVSSRSSSTSSGTAAAALPSAAPQAQPSASSLKSQTCAAAWLSTQQCSQASDRRLPHRSWQLAADAAHTAQTPSGLAVKEAMRARVPHCSLTVH